MPEWNEQANEIFLTAVELPSNEARRDYLAQACGGDVGLRLQVDELLRANASAGDFLEEPIGRLPADLQPEKVLLAQIGPYRILEQIGEGGMGVVFLAAQETPVRRKVALKVVKPGMDTKQVLARFEAERQAIALMDHPHIARVLDAGTTAQGRPYFVMELVRGVPITTYCQRHRLSRRERLQLFVQVCQAVAHAHQKGIIHRDLKPTNILVAQLDGRPQAKVIDFGVAKAVGQSLTDKTLHTGFTQLVGTPAYMSPEQAGFGAVDIDTRSDVYSLGVLLYELLTGTTPFTDETLRQAGPDAFRRMIREDDPPRPSARISTLSAKALSTLAEHDSIAPHRFGQSLRGELDWIVMQALDKDRNRRYESANELAADIERYLRDEPVRACPPTTLYLLQKFARRHRAALSTGVLIVLALLGGTAIAIWQAIDAVAARKLADERLHDSQASLNAASIARRHADEERDKARANAERTRRLLYAGDLRSALEAWQHNDVRKMRELLAQHIPEPGQADLRGFEWHFLWRHTSVESQVVFQSDRPLYCVRLDPQGKIVAVTGADGRIHLLSSRTFAPIRTIETMHGEVNGIEFSPDGTELASAGDDGMVVVWDPATGQQRLSFRAYEDVAFNVLFADDSLVTCGRHPDVRIWSRKDGRLERALKKHEQTVQAIARCSLGYIAAASDDDTVSCWDLNRPDAMWRDGGSAPTKAIAFSAVGDLLAEGHNDGMLSLRTPDIGLLLVRQQFPDVIHSLAFSPGIADTPLSWLAVGDGGGSIHLMPINDIKAKSGLTASTPEQSSLRQLQGHTGRVYSLVFTPDAQQLFSAGEDGGLRVWQIESEQSSRAIASGVSDFAILDAQHVVTVGQENLVHDLESLTTTNALPGLSGKGEYVRYDAANDQILASDSSHRLIATSLDGMQQTVLRQPLAGETLGRSAVSPDGRQWAVVVGLGNDRWLELSGLGETRRLPCDSIVHDIEFSPDGSFVLIDQVKDVQVVDAQTAEVAARWKGHRSTLWDLAQSPDGRHVASVSKDRQARIWEWPSGREVWSQMAHAIETECVAFSPNGRTLATCGADRLLRLWRWQEDMLVLEYPLADWPAEKMAFTPDGSKLLVLSRGRLRLYDASPGRAL